MTRSFVFCLGRPPAISTSAWIALVLGSSTAIAGPAEPVSFSPHRAIYDLTLLRSSPGSGVNDMTGRLVYELTGAACEGYTQAMRFVTQASASDGAEQISDMRSTSFEENAGRRLSFNTTQFRDDKMSEKTEGQAGRRTPSGAVTVELSLPEKKALDLPANVYFPMQHSVALMQAAKEGQTRFVADVYDGSEKGDKFSATNTMIGKPNLATAGTWPASVANLESLKTLRYWPVATSYFEKDKSYDKKDALPNYEMAFNFFENGVSTKLVMDYGDFSLRGELKELTFLDQPKCAQAKQDK
jgi:EipB-like